MGSILLFLTLVAAIVAWWLVRQRLTSKPWLEEGPLGEAPGTGASPLPAATLGLGVFLVIVGTLFSLLISAYSMRMTMTDWRPLPVPDVLWINSGLLVASSVALQLAHSAVKRGRMDDLKLGLLGGAGFALLFLFGPDPGVAATERGRAISWRATRPTPSSICWWRCMACIYRADLWRWAAAPTGSGAAPTSATQYAAALDCAPPIGTFSCSSGWS